MGERFMPHVNIWVHLIWTTKNRYPYLKEKIRVLLLKHIRENALSKKIHLDFLNGVEDHIHALISLKPDQNISQVVRLLKGESSHWINHNKLIECKFGWQDEYMAISVEKSRLNQVREYIKNQESHHRKKSFAEEYREFIQAYGNK
jgi:REP element-mobilizing transposase RayT